MVKCPETAAYRRARKRAHACERSPTRRYTQATNDARNTPAHYACQQKHPECLKALFACTTVDVLSKNEFGRSVLTEAIATGDAT